MACLTFGAPRAHPLRASYNLCPVWLVWTTAANQRCHSYTPVAHSPRLAEIQALVRDCKLAALEAEARTAKALALKAAKAVETIEIDSLDGITQAQTYRSNLWPSVSPSIKPALDAAQRGERLVVSEETKKHVEQLKTLM